jgi:2-polyprenyl-3-methyl-5-hydroxy-6-metoxy-1,4-benzoquinol methylase
LLLGNRYKKHLVDISPQALQFAKHTATRLHAKHVKFTQENGFDTKLQSKKYDFVWNIGVIEHYSRRQATAFVAEMVRLTKDGGRVAIAVPNFKSFHIWKAKILNKPIFKYIPGYRLDSENDYSEADISAFIAKACKRSGREMVLVESFRIGNPLPMSSPKLLVNTIGRPINALLIQRRFLIMVIVKLES